jgi:hypothetical protein
MRPFAVVRGLPGAGGVTTEAAELRAMGTNSFVHLGTAGLLSPDIPYGQLVVSEGSYRDGAAFLLENESNGQISRPDQSLTNEIVETVNKDNVKHIRAIGFTMPIYYFQPASILRGLLGMSGPDAPRFVEMEEASFFALAHLMGFRAASIVVASDRLESHDGKLSQGFWDGDLDQLELLAFQEAIHAIAGPIPHCHQSESSFQRRSDGADKRERIPGSKSDDGGARGRADRDRPAELYQSLAPRPDRPFAACAAGEAQRPR